jgi:hypothetical protein
MALTQPHVMHRRQREVLAVDGQVPTKSLRTRAPLRRPTSIGLESGGVLREFDHRFTLVAPLRLACRARAIRWCSHGPALSGLLPPSPAVPGSDCPQLPQAAATARRRGLTPRPIRQRLVAHHLGLHDLLQHAQPDADRQRQQPLLRGAGQLAPRLPHPRRQRPEAVPLAGRIGGVVYGPHGGPPVPDG